MLAGLQWSSRGRTERRGRATRPALPFFRGIEPQPASPLARMCAFDLPRQSPNDSPPMPFAGPERTSAPDMPHPSQHEQAWILRIS